jgi:hypothetical protein
MTKPCKIKGKERQADELKRVVANLCATPGLSEGRTRGEFGA